MDYTRMLAISAAGMAAERTRVEVAAANIANANTTAGSDRATFQPQRVMIRSVPLGSLHESGFARQMAAASLHGSGVAVPQASVEAMELKPRLIHDPGHPLADSTGFVRQPGVDAAREMVTLLSAMRAYEANVAVASATRSLALKTLDLGGGA